jgi:hypothetical protein
MWIAKKYRDIILQLSTVFHFLSALLAYKTSPACLPSLEWRQEVTNGIGQIK